MYARRLVPVTQTPINPQELLPFEGSLQTEFGTSPGNRLKRTLGGAEGFKAIGYDCSEIGHYRSDDCWKEPSAFNRKIQSPV